MRRHPRAPAPLGCLPFINSSCCSQGGGVAIFGGQVTFQSCEIHNNKAAAVRCLLSNHVTTPSAPVGALLGCLLSFDELFIALQGGGVWILSGTVSFNTCNIYENTATYVCARFLNLLGHFPHRPLGCLLLLTFAVRLLCTLAGSKLLAL